MTTSRFSRRSLFGLGIGQVVEKRLGALDLSGAEPEAPAKAATNGSARRKEAAPKAWGEGAPRALSARLEPAAAHLLEVCGVARGQRLLDVGAGDGNLALAAARAGAEVAAGDLSPVLVERGRERSRGCGLEVDWSVADVEALPYADESFDCVASNFGVIYADDARRAVAELDRVVRPGGTVALTAWASSGLMGRVLRMAAERDGSVGQGTRPERWGRYETALLHFSRFEEFEMLDGTLRMHFDSVEEMWELFSAPPGPLTGALLRAGADAGDLREEFLRLVAGALCEGTAGVVLEAAYSVVLGRRQVAEHLLPRRRPTN